MRDTLFILISVFVAGNILTEWRNRNTLPWMSNPMSSYIAYVPWSWMQDAEFCVNCNKSVTGAKL